MAHHYDIVPDDNNPEVAQAVIINSFNKEFYLDQTYLPSSTGYTPNNNPHSYQGVNTVIADSKDYQSTLNRFVVWTKDINFEMTEQGDIVGEVVEHNLGVLPFIDIYQSKDFEYFVRSGFGESLVDFSIQFNGALSDLAQIVKMQGWAQATLVASADTMPESVQVGPNYILKLIVDPNNPITPSFSYNSPSPDLTGAIQYLETLLATFLSSLGVDPKTISGKTDSTKFTSGIERLLAMVEKIDASKADYEVFKTAERQIFEVIKAWQKIAKVANVLDPKYMVDIPDEVYCCVNYSTAKMVMSEKDDTDIVEQQMNLGLIGKVDAIRRLYNVSKEEAEERIKEIKLERQLNMSEAIYEQGKAQDNADTDRSESDDRLE
jgi:hypothetical protein